MRTGSTQVRTTEQVGEDSDRTSRALSNFMFDFRNGDPELSRVIEEVHQALYPSAGGISDARAGSVSSRDCDRVERELLAALRAGLFSISPQPAPSPARRQISEFPQLGPEAAKEEEEELSFLSVELVDEDGNPVGNVAYEVLLPDGHTRTGVVGASGKATLRDIPAGQCKLTFPDLDGASWSAG